MKRLLLASSALAALLAGPAGAADLPVRPPVYSPAAPAIYSWWTGCYVGGNVGGAWARAHYTYENIAAVVEDFDFKPISLIGGGQAGCQYQWGGLVLGFEGTWSWTNLHQTNPSLLLPNRERSIAIDQIATVTGRVGYAFDRTMLYAKAGWAGVRVNTHAVNHVSEVFSDFSDWSNGWTVGVGLEHVPWRSIVVGVEANYYRATFDHSGQDSVGGVSRNFNASADIFAATLRASYLFGQTAPVY